MKSPANHNAWMAGLYLNAGLPVPRHLTPDLRDNHWRAYEHEKEIFGIVSPEVYDEKIKEVAP